MFGMLRIALRAFVLGFLAGALLAPRQGVETRRLLREKFTLMANQLLDVAGLPPIAPTLAGANGRRGSQAVRRPRTAEESGAASRR